MLFPVVHLVDAYRWALDNCSYAKPTEFSIVTMTVQKSLGLSQASALWQVQSDYIL